MEKACTNLTQVVRSERLFKIDRFSMTSCIGRDYSFKSIWSVDGYDWEVRIYPRTDGELNLSWVSLRLVFLSEARTRAVRTTLRCCLVDPRGRLKPSKEDSQSIIFRKPQDSSSQVPLTSRCEPLELSGYVKDDSFTVQCSLEVFKELPDVATVSLKEVRLPPSNLHLQFSQLLQSETGADVTFVVSGESFAAHKLILAARSPVFMAEFFGEMKKDKCSPSVEIEDMEAAIFKDLLHFIYTDTVPEFGQKIEADVDAIYADTVPEFVQQEEAVTVMAQNLLAAADRYGLDRLKLICASELSGGINVDTAATALALAEQHNCPELKARCVDFIIRTSATLDAVLATEGFKHLEARCPLLVIELLKSARGRKT